jgi:hypothetical protein
MRIRSVAFEFGIWRCERNGRSSGSVTGGNGSLRASPGAVDAGQQLRPARSAAAAVMAHAGERGRRLAAGTGILRTARTVAVGSGTVQRIKAELATLHQEYRFVRGTTRAELWAAPPWAKIAPPTDAVLVSAALRLISPLRANTSRLLR